MNAIVYVNTPLEAPEHAALAALARQEGRAKGQQLRLLAIQAMQTRGKGGRCGDGGSGGSGLAIGPAGSDAVLALAVRSGERKRASAAASRVGDGGTAGGTLAPAGEALAVPVATRTRAKGERAPDSNARTSRGARTKNTMRKGGRV